MPTPTQVLVNVISVTNLAAGASVTVAHGLKEKNQGVTPTLVFPDRGTNIKVTAATATTITFQNDGASLETLVKFRVERGLSQEVDVGLLPTMYYGGGSGSPSGGGSSAGSGGYTYYLNSNAADLPEPTAGDRELSLTYSSVPATLGPTIPADSPAYTQIEEWVTDIGDPGATGIPPGIWQLGIYAKSSHSDGLFVRFKVSKWDGVTLTTIATSSDDQISNTGGFALNNVDVFVPYTALSASDRLVITLEATKTVSGNRELEVELGGTSPAHIHTTFGSPGGTGLVKVVNGVVQDPASLLVDADVAANAAIAVTKLAAGTNGYFLSTVLGVPTWVAFGGGGGAASSGAYVAKSAGYIITTSDYAINCTSGTFTLTLPPAATAGAGRMFVIKNSGAGVITVDGDGAETIDGAATYTISTQYAAITVMSTGSNWIIL